jgi:hypothetical protein
MTNCVFQVRRGAGRLIGIQNLDLHADNPWMSLVDALQRFADRYSLAPRVANDPEDQETVVTLGILEMLRQGRAVPSRGKRPRRNETAQLLAR